MLTINPDSTPEPLPAEQAQETTAEAPIKAEAPKKPMSMAWIPATLGLGLLLAIVYLGGRILTAKAHTSPAAPPAPVAQKAPAPPVVQPQVAPAPPTQPEAAKPEPPKPDPFQPKTEPVLQAKVEPPPTPVAQPKIVPAPPKPAETAKAAEPPATAASSDDLAGLPTITPQAGQRYVQIGALIPKAAHRYLGSLHLGQMDLHVAPGPTPELIRVLVGPFPDRDASAAVQAQLDAQGIQNFVRVY